MLNKRTLIFNFGFIIISLLLASYYIYSVDQDQVSYLSIAKKYLSGEWEDAINGVWSPLLSWLLIPFLVTGIEPVFAFKIVQLLAGLLTLNIFLLFLDRYSRDIIFTLGGIATAVIIMSSAFLTGTPDLLMAGILLLYLYTITRKDYLYSNKLFLLTGVITAAAYYAKAYAFPFFLLHFTVVTGYRLFRHREFRSKIIKGYLTAVVTSLFLSLPWVTLLTIKYDHLTYSTAGEFNFAVVGPEYNNVHQFRMQGLIPPVNETAVSYWEDPTFLNYDTWNPFNSTEEFMHLTRVISNNILKLLLFFFTYSPLLLILLIIPGNKKEAGQFLLTIILYSSGLLVLFIEQRFLILPHLLIILATLVLTFRLSVKLNSNTAKIILYTLVFLSILFRPAYIMLNNLNNNKNLYLISRHLDDKISGNIASYSSLMLDREFGHSLFFSYMVNARYFGEIVPGNARQIKRELDEHKIDYLLVWNDRDKFSEYPFIKEEYKYRIPEGESLLDSDFINSMVTGIYKTFNLERYEKETKMLIIYKVL